MADSTLVSMRGITKTFPGVLANSDVNFEAKKGEIHALLGENGAGKSTLMNILTGLYRPDEGEIWIKGEKVVFRSPKEAIAAGIGMVHQHFRLVQPFTVAENLILGSPRPGRILNMKQVEKEITSISKKFGLEVDPRAKIWQLSVGEQQRVEIIKMLYRGADILILDEPTAVLTPQEVKELFKTLRMMADEGRAVIIITHKLHEVMAVADRVTVLRGGKYIGTVNKKETTKQELTKMMVGREIELSSNQDDYNPGEDVLILENINALNDKGYPALKNVNLTVKEGEILGIAGVAGNGQRELAEVVTGLREIQSGTLKINSKQYCNCSPLEIIDAGVAHIPEDRLGMGLVPSLGAVENIMLKEYRKKEMNKGLFLNHKLLKKKTGELIEEFGVKTASIDSPVKLMSGGNLQRLLIAREISCQPKFIVASYPVRGLDVGAIEAVHRILLEQRKAGAAILLISEDLEEIFALADRIAVLYEGEVMGVIRTSETTVEEIGLMMAGSREGEKVS
ncbi:MAG: ral nucleoside transport system ATP-binding protein [Clostridia bacterium]|nr:transporter related protein [Clostridiales bacterium]MDK2985591.1 ral nucleoside transport system ATP-binding protein [Clostridia bacterium]